MADSAAQNARMYDDEIGESIDNADELVEKARASSGSTREQHIRVAQDELKCAKKALHTLKTEIRSLSGAQKAKFEKAAKAHLSKINEVQGECKQLLADDQREQELQAAAAPYVGDDADEDPSRHEARGIAKKIEKHQQNSLESLARTEGTLARTEVTAAETADKLKKQGDQLRNIDAELDALGSDIQRARRELHAFARRMATDRLILCCMCLLVVGILVVIVLHFVNPDESTDSDNGTPAPTPPPPAPATTG